jgi:oxidase EvaA
MSKTKSYPPPSAPKRELPGSTCLPDILGFDGKTAGEIYFSRTTEQALHPDRYVDEWVAERLATPRLSVEPIPISDISRWHIEANSGNICHDSGKFFTLTGVKVRHRSSGGELEWDQPIIDQPEIGILGILVKRINGVLHFCLQAKEEPGNINSVQLSPTVQATYSNYTKAHGGDLPPFVRRFFDPPRQGVLFAKLQSEDGGRFLFKSNRNMVVQLDDNELEELPSEFIWLTLRQIARLIRRDNLIHACTRSILSSFVLPPADYRLQMNTDCRQTTVTLAEAIQWLDDQKAANHIFVKREGLNTLKEWGMDREGCFSHLDGRFFRVIGIDIRAVGREVRQWSQPILANTARGIIGLLTKVHGGERYFLMQAKAEVGNRSAVQLGPTVQFTPGNYVGNPKLPKPFLFDEFSGDGAFPLLWQNLQAEEGARFFQETHLHRILALPEGADLDCPPEFHWLPETQVRFFLHLGDTVNSCARSIISCLL